MNREKREKTKEELQEEITKLLSVIEAYKKSGIEMGMEITTLKHQLAGSKGRNKQIANRVTELQTLIEQCKQNYKESEECIHVLEARMVEKEKVIEGLNSQVANLTEKITREASTIKERHDEISKLKAQIDQLKRPWWKKLFM